MTDQIFETHLSDTDSFVPDEAGQPEQAPADQVEVRRNVTLSAVLGAVSGLLTVAFAARAFGDGGPLDWALLAVLGAITVMHLAAVADGRAPLLVADQLGVRLREGAEWQGIAWEHIECLEHLPRRLPFHDGHLLVVGETGQQLIVPLTMATRVVGTDPTAISDGLAELSDGRADVVEVVPGIDEDEDDVVDQIDPIDVHEVIDPEPPTFEKLAMSPEETVKITRRGIAAEVEKRLREPEAAPAPSPSPGPGRPVLSASRVEVQRADHNNTGSHPTIGANALRMEPVADADADEQAEVELTLTVVLDDVAVQPAAEPVIGPLLEAARDNLRLSVDQLSERTRIRPHVIEAIEVDDFGPCGGDFYARGHLRTLARVLGVDATPLVATYDEQYADAPVDPRRVFESELATGVGGSIRGTKGGRNWSVLLAAVMAAILVWSIARLVMDGPVDLGNPSTLRPSMGTPGNHRQAAPPTVPVTLTATAGGARLLVRDGQGKEIFDGQLAFGQTTKLKVSPPVRIWSSDGSVTAAVDCKDPVALGDTGVEVTKTLAGC
ncbi:helix-turn-helix domain-containing protein [Nocardioides humilatus]|uniref:Helix-turn-helix domain-containing protein n=1 Tax=Nocardioides humilatus TaxID=2607660 RepID=A0A5B1LB52_9ACTN|nr:helix-turn-helix transcriptional regulator [Nocardioides humilatus]KAA1417000.1 helix-turn-helix domain-containing protein [Nocardioides humilatus]